MSYDYDYFVIGAGSAGVRSSRIAATHGARVAVAEEHQLGGTCVNVGCVPKKLFVYAAQYHTHFEDCDGYGWQIDNPRFDWQTLLRRKNAEIERLNGIYENVLDKAGVTILNGRARLLDPHTIDVAGKRVTADKVLIATGGKPRRPTFPGAEHIITSDDAFYLDRLPERVVVVGAGYIAIEFGCIFEHLGCRVVLVHRREELLRGFDVDLRKSAEEELCEKGIEMRLSSQVTRIDELDDNKLRVHLDNHEPVDADAAFFAIGRVPNTNDLGLEKAGVETDQLGAIIVDDDYQTSCANIWAVGDVTNRVNLTPVAIAEGHALANRLFGPEGASVDYRDIPTAVFSIPELATVGYTEAEARARFGQIDVYAAKFRPMKHTLSGRNTRVTMKLLVERATDKVVGCHMFGDGAAEIMQAIAIAIKAGATKAHFDATVALHPSTAEEFVLMRTPR